MEDLKEYFDISVSYKEYYIMNNDSISEDVSLEKLFYNVDYDADIILRALNISPSKCGYRYWKDAIFIYICSGKSHLSICNEIYPAIAQKYGKTRMSVERAMRLCFENTMYYVSKKNANFIGDYLKNSLLYPHSSEILIKLVELIVSKDFQKNKFKI